MVEKLNKDILKLYKKDLKLKMKIVCLEKQRKFHLKKLRDLGNYKAQNILKLEVDKRLKEAPPLNLFSPSTFPVDINWT